MELAVTPDLDSGACNGRVGSSPTRSTKLYENDIMKKIVELRIEIRSCNSCPLSQNPAQMHDDPFTSTPISRSCYCTERNVWIDNPEIVDPKCTLDDAK